jgi:hypothetical protein
MPKKTQAWLTCPGCGFIQMAEMPLDARQFFYQCVRCKAVMWPKPGECCVFCSFADTPCPSKQTGAD